MQIRLLHVDMVEACESTRAWCLRQIHNTSTVGDVGTRTVSSSPASFHVSPRFLRSLVRALRRIDDGALIEDTGIGAGCHGSGEGSGAPSIGEPVGEPSRK